MKVPKSTVSSIIRKWKENGMNMELPTHFLELAHPTKVGKDLGEGGDQEPNDHSDRTTEFLG